MQMVASQHLVTLDWLYSMKQMGHSRSDLVQRASEPFSRGARRPSPMSRRICLGSHSQDGYNPDGAQRASSSALLRPRLPVPRKGLKEEGSWMLGICRPEALLFDPPPVMREEKLFAAPVRRELLLPAARSLPLREEGDAVLVDEELPMVYRSWSNFVTLPAW